jgi:divalent metal cation (Fe/Co/Zn/Cd) transporter
VLPAVIGSWLYILILDPVFALVISIAIVFITWDAIVAMWYRLMDAVDPHLVDHAETALRKNTLVQEIIYLRMRWVGHNMQLESCILVDPKLEFSQIYNVRKQLERELIKELPHLSKITISISPHRSQQGKCREIQLNNRIERFAVETRSQPRLNHSEAAIQL